MYSYEERLRAVQLFLRTGKNCKVTIRQLGYPTKNALKAWCVDFEQNGDVLKRYQRTKPKYSEEQKKTAVSHFMANGRCIAATIRSLGYPSRQKLSDWVCELYPEAKQRVVGKVRREAASLAFKRAAVFELCTRNESAQVLAEKLDVDRVTLYNWKKQLLGKEGAASMKHDKGSHADSNRLELEKQIQELQRDIRDLKLEHDLLKKANELLKKDLGVDLQILCNREKTMLIDALREEYDLTELLKKLDMPRSSYFYHRSPSRVGDKYAEVRNTLAEVFEDNHHSYGYRRLKAALGRERVFLSEKVVRRLMKQGGLKAARPKKRRYASYVGEVIQAYSRTNRVFDAKKSHGNVVSYRNLKDATDEALAIFANKNAKSSVDEVIGTVIMQPYEDLVEVFRVEVEKLKAIAPDVDAVDNLIKEEDQLDFIVKFRDVLRLQNTLKTFSQFDGDLDKGGLGIDEQGLLDYQSKYLDLREDIEAAERERRKVKPAGDAGGDSEPEPPSPIQQVLFGIDFQIELIKRDEITVSYILGLIEKLKDQSNEKKFAAGRDMILDVLQSNPDLRSKRDLFETFIDEELDKLRLEENQHAEGVVITTFNEFVDKEKQKALEAICTEFSADREKLKELYQDFVYRGTLPDRNTLINLLAVKPKITKRAEVGELMRERFAALADKFEDAEFEQ